MSNVGLFFQQMFRDHRIPYGLSDQILYPVCLRSDTLQLVMERLANSGTISVFQFLYQSFANSSGTIFSLE